MSLNTQRLQDEWQMMLVFRDQIRDGRLKEARAHYDENPWLLTRPSPGQGITFLHQAVLDKQVEMARWLASVTKNLDTLDPDRINTPLRSAISWRPSHSYDIARILLDAGADPNLCQPLFVLVHGRNKEDIDMVERFVKAGAKINDENLSGETPLVCASMAGNVEMVKALLALGAEIYPKDIRRNALENARHLGHEPVVQVIEDWMQAQAARRAVDRVVHNAIENSASPAHLEP